MDELFNDRFPNEYLGDTNLRLAVDIYTTGLGEKIENMFREMLEGPGEIKATVHKYVGKV